MKKALTILFSMIYLIATTGVAFNIHHCSHEGTDIKIIPGNVQCCCSTESKPATCCDDETVYVQVDEEQHVKQNVRSFKVYQAAVVTNFLAVDNQLVEVKDKNINVPYGEPPEPSEPPIWLLNCSYTTYS